MQAVDGTTVVVKSLQCVFAQWTLFVPKDGPRKKSMDDSSREVYSVHAISEGAGALIEMSH